MNARLNKNLIVLPKVVLTPTIEAVICFLDAQFAKKGEKGFVTSGHRNENNQLQIIQDFAVAHGVAKKFMDVINCRVEDKMMYEGKEVFKWQPAWSKLLNIGIIVNPPKRARCLFDYINASGVNRKGEFINPSPHFFGKAFDIGGGADGVLDELAVVKPLVGTLGIKGYLLERKQNCLHVDCY